MRKLTFIFPLAVLITISACNNSSTESTTTGKDTTHAAMDMTTTIAPVPAIPASAKVFFKNLKDGQTVTSPFKVEMGAEGIRVDSAGKLMDSSGHHHLLIDAGDSLTAGTVVPKDSTHLHFGNAQTETTVTLAPGKHRLTLQFADGLHRSYGSKLSSSITVDVKK
ncbi:MAG: DUF4399 domain-containing protein [Bacteroidetes bacterium]|nr:DUF4399 domain-containing protein [Bacteroidota bacterium]